MTGDGAVAALRPARHSNSAGESGPRGYTCGQPAQGAPEPQDR
jgi:hypothetical protein